MPKPSELIRIVAVTDPGSTQQQISNALSSQSEFQLVDVLSPAHENLSKTINELEPDIILIDHPQDGEVDLDLIDKLVQQFPDTSLVAFLPQSDPLIAQQVMLAGASAFILQPFTQINLLSTLRRVYDLQSRRRKVQITAESVERAKDQYPLRTYALFSPRGGVGCSTIAINLAYALYEETNARILLVEGKLMFGHLGVMLNIRTRNSIADLIPHASNLDEQLINDVVTHHRSGIFVLLAPTDVQIVQGIRSQDLYNILLNLERYYDYIVIDAGSYLNENAVTFLDAADRIMVITTPEMAALHDASRFLQISQSLAYEPEKVLIILNRADMQAGLKPKDVESSLRTQLFLQIPDDVNSALRSLNRGVPMNFRYPRSKASRAIEKAAKEINRSVSQAQEFHGSKNLTSLPTKREKQQTARIT